MSKLRLRYQNEQFRILFKLLRIGEHEIQDTTLVSNKVLHSGNFD